MTITGSLARGLSDACQGDVWKPAIAATWLMIRRDGDAAKCWAGDDLKSICHDELHNWPIQRPHRGVPCSIAACGVIQSQPRIGDLVFASRSGAGDRFGDVVRCLFDDITKFSPHTI